MKPLTVAMDMRLAGYRMGGIARYAEELQSALAARSDVRVVELRSRRDRKGAQTRRLRTPPHHRLERYAVGVELLLARVKPDVYHATDFVAPRLPGVPIVATVHDLEFLRHPEYLDERSLAYYRQIATTLGWTNAWIAPSRWTADDLIDRLDIDPTSVFVVPHGLPPKHALRNPIPRAARTPHLLLVGTLEPRKRHDLLLDALAALESPPPIVIVGSAGWKSEGTMSRIAKNAHATWRQGVDDAELWDLYRNAFAVVIPSESEGFGLPALEAMAAGTPVVSSGRGALPEVTGPAALVPDSDDPRGWAGAIQRILDDEALWNELSLFGQRRAREFSWDRAASATMDVYKRVARR